MDSDFLGLHGKEDRADPDNVRSRTGYVILLNKCPIIWSSHLQSSISTSTMMAEHCALSAAMREVLPLRALARTAAAGCGINVRICLPKPYLVMHFDICEARSADGEPLRGSVMNILFMMEFTNSRSKSCEFPPRLCLRLHTRI